MRKFAVQRWPPYAVQGLVQSRVYRQKRLVFVQLDATSHVRRVLRRVRRRVHCLQLWGKVEAEKWSLSDPGLTLRCSQRGAMWCGSRQCRGGTLHYQSTRLRAVRVPSEQPRIVKCKNPRSAGSAKPATGLVVLETHP